MNFEELTVRGNEFGVNSITHEVNKEHDKLGNWDNYEYWIIMLILETIWYTCPRVTIAGWRIWIIRGHEITYGLQDKLKDKSLRFSPTE